MSEAGLLCGPLPTSDAALRTVGVAFSREAAAVGSSIQRATLRSSEPLAVHACLLALDFRMRGKGLVAPALLLDPSAYEEH